MANKLTAENIEAAAQHLENIQTGKTPILDGVDRTVEDAEIIEPLDLGNQVIKEERETSLSFNTTKRPKVVNAELHLLWTTH